MNRLELDAEQVEVLEGLGRAMALNVGWSVHVLVAEEPRSLRPALVFVLGACLGGEGEVFEVRHFDHQHDDEAMATLETLLGSDAKVRQLIFVDFSQLDERDDFRACDFFTKLNSRRDRMRTHLRGELVLAIPSRLEASMLSAGPDLASGLRPRLLRRGAFDHETLERWRSNCDERFHQLLDETPDAADRYQYGTYTFTYCFEPGAVEIPLGELRERLATAPSYTGWSPWWVPTNKSVPRITDGALECWMFGPDQLFPDPAHSDFWRASPHGELYLRRGYDEDSTDSFPAGQTFSNSLAIWRTAEALLHVDGYARVLGLPRHLRVGFAARWSGLAGRELSSWPDKPALRRGRVGHAADASETIVLTLAELPDGLPAFVGRLVAPLFDCFEGHRPTPQFVAEHVRRLVERR